MMGNQKWLEKRSKVWADIIAANVRAARERLRWSQAELGRRANLVAPVITRLESGLHFPSLATLLNVAEALGISPGKLFKHKEKK